MANILLIEDEERIERDMTKNIREINDNHRVRCFHSSTLFEEVYFKQNEEETVTLVNHPLVKDLGDPIIDYILTLQFEVTPAFNPNTLKMTLGLEDMAIEKTNSKEKNILGLDTQKFFDDPQQISKLVDAKFKMHWTKLIEDLGAKGKSKGIIPITSPDDRMWLVFFDCKKNDDNFEIIMKDSTATLLPLIKDEIDRRESAANKEDALQILSSIDLIIFKNKCIDEDVRDWVFKIRRMLKDKNMWPEEHPTRFIATKYENDGVETSALIHPYIDDLICLPLDKLIFLQKVEIVLGLPNKTMPQFLFTQDVDIKVEISKLTTLERLSDMGFAIKNPVGLKDGILGHFYLRIPSPVRHKPDKTISFYAKAIKSTPHPSDTEAYLVYFTYFGVAKDVLTTIKGHLQTKPSYKPFVTDEAEKFVFNDQNLFLTDEDKRERVIAVIDVDEDIITTIKNRSEKHMPQARVIAEKSPYVFIKKYLRDIEEEEEDDDDSEFATPEDIYKDVICWTINSSSLDLDRLLTKPKKNDELLGHLATELFSEPQQWLDLFKLKETRKMLDEVLNIVRLGNTSNFNFILVDSDEMPKVLDMTFKFVDDETIRIEMRTPEEDEADAGDSDIESLDVIVIDQSLLPPDIDSWITGINEMARKCGVRMKGQEIKVIVTGSSFSEKNHEKLRKSKVMALLEKPLENRFLLFLLSVATHSKYSMFNFDNIGWVNTKLPCHIAKNAKLEILGEFGAAVRHPRPLAPGCSLFLHGSIFDHAPDNTLCAHFYHCKDHELHRGQYLCTFLYFGINDSFLKYTRSWIRDNYASRKNAN